VVVMQALFERRKRRFEKKMQETEEAFAERKKEMDEEVARCKARTVEVEEEAEKKLKALKKEYEDKLKLAVFNTKELEDRTVRAEKAVAHGEREIRRLNEVEKNLRFEIEDLNIRLKDTERAEELRRKTEQVELLENELRRMKKKMEDRKHAEAEALRKELMEYVKFIVRILPENWQSTLQPELMQRLSQHSDVPLQLLESAEMGEPEQANAHQFPPPLSALPQIPGGRGASCQRPR